jgi:hypothetical protein
MGGLAAFLLVALTERSSDAGWCCWRSGGGYRESARKYDVVPPISSKAVNCSPPYYPGRCNGTTWIVPCNPALAVGCVHKSLSGTSCAIPRVAPGVPSAPPPTPAEDKFDFGDGRKHDIGKSARWLYPVVRQSNGTFIRAVFYQPIDAYLPREYVTPEPKDPTEEP